MFHPLRVGLFPYLNVQPLVAGLGTDPEIEVLIDVPSRIADRFRSGELDLAMVPSFEAASLGAPVLDSICIASDGPVETVILHHRVPLKDVRTVALDEASRTSAALSKILIAQDSGRMPASLRFAAPAAPPEGVDAILVIGDPAFTYARQGFERLDLGLAWQSRYGLPFVFAVMVVRPRAIAPGMAERMRTAIHRGLAAAPTIAHSYNSGVDADRAFRYMRTVIRYELARREKEGLALFYRLAVENGLLPDVRELEFHAI